jgi:hypothetical protein
VHRTRVFAAATLAFIATIFVPAGARADADTFTFTVAGRIVDSQGHPLAGIDVWTLLGEAASGADGTFAVSRLVTTGDSDTDYNGSSYTVNGPGDVTGTLLLSYLDPAGNYSYGSSAANSGQGTQQVTLSGSSVEVGAVSMALISTTVTGRFVSASGKPVANVIVLGQLSNRYYSDQTPSDGTFTLRVSGYPSDGDLTGGSIDLSWTEPTMKFLAGHEAVRITGPSVLAGDIALSPIPPILPSKDAINTASKKAVVAWFHKLQALERFPDHGSPVRGCSIAPTPPVAVQKHTLASINLMRALVGEDPVSLNATYTKKAQRAALITFWNGLNHFPPRTAKCWSQAGYDGASHSNLYDGLSGARAVLGYMDDSRNITGANAGHRSWLIDPATRYMGVGQTTGPGAVYVVDDKSNSSNPRPKWISWPTPGYFPSQIEPSGLWSFMTTEDYDLSRASVSVTFAGKKVALRKQYVGGYGGMQGLVWQLSVPRTNHLQHYAWVDQQTPRTGTYTVSVSGFKLDGTVQPRYSYKVILFRA